MSEQPTPATPTLTLPQSPPKGDPFRLGWRHVPRRDENGLVQVTQVPLSLEDVLHPLDGDVIVSNDYHSEDCIYLRNALRQALNGRPNVRVFKETHIDLGLEGVKAVVPEVAVYSGVSGEWDRMKTFYPARIGAKPELVIEITSPSTRSIDLNTKPMLYCRAKVPVYAVVDYCPEMEERAVTLLAYRLTPEGYLRIPADERGRIWLDLVRLWLAPDGERVVLLDQQGQRIPAHEELVRSLKQIDARNEELQNEAETAIIAKREQEKARKLAEEKAADEAKARKAAEEKAADEAKARKEAEQKAADLASKFAQMEAELRRLRGEQPS